MQNFEHDIFAEMGLTLRRTFVIFAILFLRLLKYLS